MLLGTIYWRCSGIVLHHSSCGRRGRRGFLTLAHFLLLLHLHHHHLLLLLVLLGNHLLSLLKLLLLLLDDSLLLNTTSCIEVLDLVLSLLESVVMLMLAAATAAQVNWRTATHLLHLHLLLLLRVSRGLHIVLLLLAYIWA